MATLFISDLHLEPRRSGATALFHQFLQQQAAAAEALYILGDLFEAWIGDDDDGDLSRDIASALKKLTDRGTPVYFVHGNRDFLLGREFAAASGLRLLPETSVIELYGAPTLIMHGDTLCTDDVEYQAFRTRARDPRWQTQMLALPLAQRRRMATELRSASQQAHRQKTEDITDVNTDTVEKVLREHGVHYLIHGHTHRPAVHEFSLNGQTARRIVLGDWYEQGSVLRCDASGCHLHNIAPQE